MDFEKIENFMVGEEAEPTDIKVLGIGGGGGNAINRMISNGLKKVTFVAMNTDVQALQRSNADVRMPIGKQLTGGLGAGGVPEMGQKAAEESKDEIRKFLTGTDMVFITAGMGGGTGTGAAPVVAEIAKAENILTVAVVTTPFTFEGKKKLELANQGIEKLRKNVDTLIIIPNQYLLKVAENNTPIKQAFLMADDVLRQGVQGISELITEPGEINIDFADVRTVMQGKGDAIMGIGIGEGTNRAIDAAKLAINNPLLENARIDGAKSILINLTSGEGLTLAEYQDVVDLVTKNCDPDALIIAGQAYNADLGDKVKVTVVATGFKNNSVEVSMSEFDKRNKQRFDQLNSNEENYVNTAAPKEPDYNSDEVINVGRWQDLQQQIGRRGGMDSDNSDFTYPAILRYKRRDND